MVCREGARQAFYPFLDLKSLTSERSERPASRRATGLVGSSNQDALLKSKPFVGWYWGIGRLCHCRQDPRMGDDAEDRIVVEKEGRSSYMGVSISS